MQTFAYTALDAGGKKRTGYIDAPDKDAAISKIAGEGKFVLQIQESAGRSDPAAPAKHTRRGKLSKSDLALFTRRLADLAAAGLPLDRALQVVSEQSESGHLQAIAEEALANVRGGMPVSEALAQHPRFFGDVFTQTLRAGEASGQFAEVAARLADFQEMEVTRRSQVGSALIYPIALTIIAISAVVVMLTFVVPRLAPVFEELGAELPATTTALLALADFLTSYGFFIMGGLVLGLFAYRAWVATAAGRYMRDRILLDLPVLGPVIKKAVVSRFARVLGMLVYGGVPILESLHLSGLATGNRVFSETSEQVREDVRDGRPIADAMRDAGAFPPVLTHMVAIGEETGDLPKMLSRVSDTLDFEVEIGMRRFVSLIEPIIIVVMALFVAFVVISILLPIYMAQELVR